MSQSLPLFLAPILLGIAGAFTPCALGVNAVFLGTVLGKSRARRVREWVIFAAARASLLTLLGLAFGLLGQTIQGFAWRFQVAVSISIIGLGLLFIVHSLRLCLALVWQATAPLPQIWAWPVWARSLGWTSPPASGRLSWVCWPAQCSLATGGTADWYSSSLASASAYLCWPPSWVNAPPSGW